MGLGYGKVLATPEDPPDIREVVESISQSRVFARSKRLISLLRFLMEETERGDSDKLNEYSIGVDVYDRPHTFDPRTDSIVRVEMRRLRSKLAEYYSKLGAHENWVLDVPVGTYRAHLRFRTEVREHARAGHHLGRYRVLSLVRNEGAVAVYKARDTVLDRIVALTVRPVEEDPDSGEVTRILEDVRRRATLSHPNICEVYETGVEQGLFYIARAFVDGISLAERLQDGPSLDAGDTLDVARQVAGGLQAAEEKGLAPFGVSSETILLESHSAQEPRAKLIDYGDTSVVASPADADVQAFGAVLQSMLAEGAGKQLPGLNSIAERCLSPDPELRPASMGDVVRDLANIAVPRRFAWPLPSVVREHPGVAALVSIALVAAIAAFLALRGPKADPIPPRIAVLPFQNLGAEGEDTGLATALTDSIISRLAQTPGIQVVSRTSAAALTGKVSTIRDIATKLRVEYVLEGTMLREGDTYRVTAQLIQSASDTHVWSGEYGVLRSGVFGVQNEVAQTVAQRIRNSTSATERPIMVGARTTTFAAFDAFGKGLERQAAWGRTLDLVDFDAAEHWYVRALELDPKYVDAMTQLGRLYATRVYPPRGPRAPWILKATSILERALLLEPASVRANALLGSLYAQEGDVVRGVQYGRAALAHGTSSAEAYAEAAEAYSAGGFYEEALTLAQTGSRMDPGAYDSMINTVWLLAKSQRFPEAHAAILDFQRVGTSSIGARMMESDILFREGKGDDAARAYPRGWNVGPNSAEQISIETVSGLAGALRGDFTEGRKTVARYRSLPGRRLDWFIRLCALVGDRDAAVDQVEKSPFYSNYRWVITEPAFAQFKRDQAFQNLVRRLYIKWQHDLNALRSGMKSPPPPLPPPEQYLAR